MSTAPYGEGTSTREASERATRNIRQREMLLMVSGSKFEVWRCRFQTPGSTQAHCNSSGSSRNGSSCSEIPRDRLGSGIHTSGQRILALRSRRIAFVGCAEHRLAPTVVMSRHQKIIKYKWRKLFRILSR